VLAALLRAGYYGARQNEEGPDAGPSLMIGSERFAQAS
jgi:hypothetical protein